MVRWTLITWAVCLGLVACGGSQKQTVFPPMPNLKEVQQSSALGAGDVLQVRVYKEKELTGVYRLDEKGRFSFPLIGEIEALGISPIDLSQQIEARLRKGYIRDPQVTIFVKEFNSKKVFVLGEVVRPGTFRYENRMTIVQAVTLAGGLKKLAAKDRVVLTRKSGGDEEKFVLPFEAISQGKAKNVFLQPGDIVFVPESWL